MTLIVAYFVYRWELRDYREMEVDGFVAEIDSLRSEISANFQIASGILTREDLTSLYNVTQYTFLTENLRRFIAEGRIDDNLTINFTDMEGPPNYTIKKGEPRGIITQLNKDKNKELRILEYKRLNDSKGSRLFPKSTLLIQLSTLSELEGEWEIITDPHLLFLADNGDNATIDFLEERSSNVKETLRKELIPRLEIDKLLFQMYQDCLSEEKDYRAC